VSVTRLALDSSLRVGFAFAGSEIAMQAIGYELGAVVRQISERAGLFEFPPSRNGIEEGLPELPKYAVLPS
jgi:hypothetical protein